MDTKKTVILGLVLIIIVGGIFLLEKSGFGKKTGTSGLFFPAFSEATCSAIRISENGNSVTIRKKGNVWVVNKSTATEKSAQNNILEKTDEPDNASPFGNYPADSASVTAVLEKISSMKKDELISQNPEKQGLFEVDSAKGTLVDVWDNKNMLLGSFIIGKNGSDWSSHFVRMIGSNDVYSVSGSIKYSFYTDENRWRDKTVLSFDKNRTKKITLTRNDSGTIVLTKTTDTAGVARWDITSPVQVPADSAETATLLNELSAYTTSTWEEDTTVLESAMGFDTPELIVAVEMNNGDNKTIVVGTKKPDTTEYWAKVNDKAVVFLLPEHKINTIKKGLDELKKKETTGSAK